MNELARFARRRPEVIIGVAAVLGFVLGQSGGLALPLPSFRAPAPVQPAAPPSGQAGGPSAAAQAAPPPPTDPLDAY